MNILLAGRGQMATAMELVCASHGVTVIRVGQGFKPDSHRTVAVHFGSGRQFLPLIELCESMGVPIIQGSTRIEAPIGRNVAIINAPNLSLPMIRFVNAFPAFAKAIGVGMKVGIVESHQRGKLDTSGTARVVAKNIGIPELVIKSVRDPDTQLALGVPQEHLTGHAYHDFIFSGRGMEIVISTRIRGRTTYAEGALVLARTIATLPKPLPHGIYELKDIWHLLPTD